MKRAHLTIAGVSCVLFAVAVAAWKLSHPAPPEIDEGRSFEEAEEAPRRSKWFWQSDDPPADPRAAEPVRPQGLAFHVYLPDSTPAAKAKVSIVESTVLSGSGGPDAHPIFACDDRRHLTTGAAALRAGHSKATVLAEQSADDQGQVTFAERAWPTSFLVRVELPGRAPYSVVQAGAVGDLYLPEVVTRPSTTLIVSNGEGLPLSGVRATIVDVASNEVREAAANGDGRLTVSVGGSDTWAILEADGYFPQPVELEAYQEELPIVLLREGTIEVTAPVSVGNFRLQLAKRHPREAVMRDGKVIFEAERPGYVSVQVTEPGYLGTADGQLPEGGRVTINLPVKRAGKLFVTVVDEQGNPIPEASALLTQPNDSAEVSATEEGQRLELGPLGEGPGVLKVSAPGFRTRSQSIDLAPGDTDLEVVLAEAPVVVGKVVDGSGQPVEDATVQVFADVPNEPAGVVTGADGRFKLHVDEEGSWTIEASDAENHFARAVVKVPTGEVTLTLVPLGTAEVLVLGVDGHPAVGAQVLMAGAESVEPDSAQTDEDGKALFEGLMPGRYRLEIDERDTEFLRESQELTVRSGDQAHATVRLRAAATIEAVAVDEHGAPVVFAMIATKDGSQSAETADDGSFTLTGFEPGQKVELTITHEEFVELSPATLTAGTKNARVTAVAGADVMGRVLNEHHEPLVEFMINGVEHYSEDGRFEAKIDKRGVLLVSDFAGASVEVKTEGRPDVGDIVLVAKPPLTGVVLDPEHRPVSSARLSSPAFDLGEVTTDGEGKFEVNLLEGSGPIQIDARSGELAAVAEVPAGAKGPIEIVLGGPTRVEGVVRGTGRTIVTTVIARGPDDQEVQVDTDVQGRFSLTMSPGFWQFGTRASRAFSSIKISGREQRIELGAADGACEVTVRGAPMPNAVYLVPAGVSWEPGVDDEMMGGLPPRPAAGVIELSAEGAAFVGRGLACSSYQVHASYVGEVVSAPVSLSIGGTQVEVMPKRLSSVGASLGMGGRHHQLIREIDTIKEPFPVDLDRPSEAPAVPQVED